jgi:RNA polymerase sigma factor (sigma-70 family)
MNPVDGTGALASEPDDQTERLIAEFKAFVEDSHPRVKRIMNAQCRDPQMVEDAMQEAYLQAMVKWPTVRAHEKPIAWVISTARNKIRQQRDRLPWESVTAPQDLPPVALNDPAGAWVDGENQRYWLLQLPARPAEVFAMSLEGFKNAEIARILGLTEMSVRSYKATAVRRLRELAREIGEQGGNSGSR